MALNAYLTLKGDTQGDIKGSVTQAGREDSIMVIATQHEVVSPRDAASGLPTGKRQHKPFVITKEIDKSTPLLMKCLVDNENIGTWRLDYWQPSPSGKEVQHYSVELASASVAGVRSEMLNNKYTENMSHKEREHVSFCYQKITWTWQDGGVTADDNWEAPVA